MSTEGARERLVHEATAPGAAHCLIRGHTRRVLGTEYCRWQVAVHVKDPDGKTRSVSQEVKNWTKRPGGVFKKSDEPPPPGH